MRSNEFCRFMNKKRSENIPYCVYAMAAALVLRCSATQIGWPFHLFIPLKFFLFINRSYLTGEITP